MSPSPSAWLCRLKVTSSRAQVRSPRLRAALQWEEAEAAAGAVPQGRALFCGADAASPGARGMDLGPGA